MTNQRQTHHLAIAALVGLAAALFIPGAFIAALAFAAAAIALHLTRQRRLAVPSPARTER